MKVLMVVHGFPPECSGGTEAYVLRLAKELIELGCRVEVVTGSHEGRPAVEIEPYEHDGIRVHKIHRSGLFVDDWDKSYAPEIEPALAGVLAAFRPDLVHVHHWIRLSRHLVEAIQGRGFPALCTLHDLWTTCPIAFRVRKGSFCTLPAGAASCHDCAPKAERADDSENAEALELFREDFANELALARRVIVPSRAHREAVLAHHPAIAGKIRVVPHGQIGEVRRRPGSGTARKPGVLRAGHWGHLSKLKGVDILLEAAASLPTRLRERLEVHVFGTIVYPTERPEIEALARKAGAALHGTFDPAELGGFDLDFAVIPTRCSESHSFVLDEAFLHGLPAIVPARGALAERIGRAGATFEPENPADLAKRLESVLDRPEVLDDWRAAIPRLRSFLAHTQEIVRVYQEVTGSRAALPTTPDALRSRRARFRSLQVEARTRKLEFLEADATNLAGDVARATATMQEMERSHREKDRVVADLTAEVRRATATMQEMERSHHEKDRVIADLTAEVGRAAATMQEMERGHREKDGVIADLTAEVGRATATMREMERGHREKDRVIADLTAEVGRATAAKDQEIARLHGAEERAHELRARIDELNVAAAEKDARIVEAVEGAERLGSELDRVGQSAEVRDRLLATAARAFADLEARLAAAEGALARTRRAPRIVESPSLVDRIKRGAFGDDRGHPGRLRILYVIHQFLPRHVAGTELYTLNLAREMRARGARVAILTCEAHHDRAPFEYARRQHEGIPVHEVVHNYKWSSFEETYDSPGADAIFERVLDEEAPDVVHFQHLHYFSANFLAIARRRGIATVYTLHDYSILCARDGQMRRADGEICAEAIPSKCADCIAHLPLDAGHVPARDRAPGGGLLVPADLRRTLTRIAAGLPAVPAPDAPPSEGHVEAAAERANAWRHAVRNVDLFVSPSAFLRDLFVRTGTVDPEKIVVSPNGTDLSRFQSMPPRTRAAALRFGYVGSIAEHKGVHVLIEAMNGLVDQPAAECRIYGDLRAFVEYTERLRALNVNPRTQLMGPFDNADVARVLAGIDVLVIPSLWYENAPLTIQEAALARVPVIASDLGGLSEHVREGRNGLLFYTGDAADLRKKLLWFVEDFSRCERFDFGSVPIVSIQDDAARTEKRYFELIGAAR